MKTRWFHGGVAGLEPGDLLLPPDDTDTEGLGPWMSTIAAEQGITDSYRPDRVYLHSDVEAVVAFAAMHPSQNGTIYEARPLSLPEPDPDWLGSPGRSVMVAEARITAVIAEGLNILAFQDPTVHCALRVAIGSGAPFADCLASARRQAPSFFGNVALEALAVPIPTKETR